MIYRTRTAAVKTPSDMSAGKRSFVHAGGQAFALGDANEMTPVGEFFVRRDSTKRSWVESRPKALFIAMVSSGEAVWAGWNQTVW